MSAEMEKADLGRVEQALQVLGEHFDSVHIFCTRAEEGILGGTIMIQKGVGNWFSRFGQIKHWMIEEEEVARIKARRANEC